MNCCWERDRSLSLFLGKTTEIAAQFMRIPKPIVPLLLYFVLSLSVIARPASAQDPPGTALITGCKPGSSVRAYRNPGGAMRAYVRLACGSSVYVWNATPKAALVQQDTAVAYVPAKYIFSAGTSRGGSPAAVRIFLQSIAEASKSSDESALSARRHLVQSCLAARGCQVEAWSHLAWTRIKQASDLVDSPDATLRLFAGGVYYSALVVNPAVRFKDTPLPSLNSPVLLIDGGGLSVAFAGHTCYALGTSGKWSAAGASAGQPAAAIQ